LLDRAFGPAGAMTAMATATDSTLPPMYSSMGGISSEAGVSRRSGEVVAGQPSPSAWEVFALADGHGPRHTGSPLSRSLGRRSISVVMAI
jgi:hypothetical protein